jgi:hypothetical protein
MLKVGRFAEEAWIIDTAGCQYGFEMFLSFEKYINTLVGKDMLNGSAIEFEDTFNGIVYELKLHILNLAN